MMNCLYLGKADGAATSLRERLRHYRQGLEKPTLPPRTHAGLFRLHQYWIGKVKLPAYTQTAGKTPPPLYLRWTVVAIARELEGRLLEMFDPIFNFDMPEPGWEDYELIDARYLLRIKRGRR